MKVVRALTQIVFIDGPPPMLLLEPQQRYATTHED